MSDKIVYRDCINWSNNDHCAKTKCNYCTKDCGDYRKLGQMPEKSALAELSKRLKRKIELHGYFYETERQDDIKAQRIVAELARMNPDQFACGCFRNLIDKCRAIAEEGAKDEKRTEE